MPGHRNAMMEAMMLTMPSSTRNPHFSCWRAARTDAMMAKIPSMKAYAENTSTSDNIVTPGWKIVIKPKIMPSTPRIAKAHQFCARSRDIC
jgi:hypothetical protein